jgi:hypothetical protein
MALPWIGLIDELDSIDPGREQRRSQSRSHLLGDSTRVTRVTYLSIVRHARSKDDDDATDGAGDERAARHVRRAYVGQPAGTSS